MSDQEQTYEGARSLFTVRGSAILSKPVMLRSILASCASQMAYMFNQIRPDRGITDVSPFYFTVVGTCLSFLLVFKSNMAYSRFWEARSTVGVICHNIRALMRRLVFATDLRSNNRLAEVTLAKTSRYLRAYFILLGQDTRMVSNLAGVASDILSDKEKDSLLPVRRRPLMVLGWIELTLRDAVRGGLLTERHLLELNEHFNHLSAGYHGILKIKASPLPFSYSQLIAMLTTVYCFCVPVCFINSFGPLIAIPTFIMGVSFFGINQVGTNLADPFGFDYGDVNLETFYKQIDEDISGYMFQWALLPPIEVVSYTGDNGRLQSAFNRRIKDASAAAPTKASPTRGVGPRSRSKTLTAPSQQTEC